MSWAMDIVADTTGQKDTQVSLIQNWSSVCYAGRTRRPKRQRPVSTTTSYHVHAGL